MTSVSNKIIKSKLGVLEPATPGEIFYDNQQGREK